VASIKDQKRPTKCTILGFAVRYVLIRFQFHNFPISWILMELLIKSARDVIANNTSHSSFISRQVASHVDRFRMLTVPELRDELGRRNLNKNGKKQQLLMRLAIWARDEIVKSSSELQDNSDNQNESTNVEKRLKVIQENDSFSYDCSDDDDSDDDDDESCSSGSSSAEELEFWDGSSAVSTASTNPTETPSTDTADEENDSLLGYLRCIFGYDNFRDGQEWAIERCLAGNRSLLIAPTGFGKSLCYALPAAMMEGVCIVVSPLISLMQDQLRSLPPRIPAATLSGSVSASMTAAILDDVARKRIKILFVSPERLTSPAFQRLFIKTWNPTTKMRERRFPSISLLCVDEAHTISQWGHNFRPCFIRVRNLVKIMEPKSILAITATAGPKVIEDIQATLDIAVAPESSESTRIISKGRDNIDVMCKFAENHEDRLNMLQKILMPRTKLSEEEQIRHPYAGSMATGSVIIYVWRKIDTEVLAENLTAAGVSGGIVVYHGGMDAHSRSRSQSRFMRGKARICVATVAFGLGIDKADIEGIIHLYLSNSPEHFLQEIGRAGRDGRPAKAIALPLSEEVPIRHSLVHSTLVSKSQIRVLLEILRNLVVAAGSEDCEARKEDPSGIIHIGVPIQSTVFACDFKSETLETFLSLIELEYEEEPVLIVEGFNYNSATIALKKRPLQKLAEREPVAKSILEVAQCVDPPISSSSTQKERITEQPINNSAFQKQFLAYSLGSYHFSITDCANHLGPTAEPRHIFAAMRRLQASNELEFALDTSETGRVCHVKVTSKGASAFYGDAFETMEENLTSKLYESFSSSNCSAAKKVLDMHYILSEVAKVSSVIDMQPRTKSRSLSRFQELMQRYFDDVPMTDNPEGSTSSNTLPIIFSDVRDKELEIDAHSLVRDLPYCTTGSRNEKTKEAVAVGNTDMIDYTVLAISKFLHGIDTPRCPSRNFRSHALFGKWRAANFSLVLEAVQKALSSGPRMITANHFDG
jgi:ATP-dependent DNA helicase Q4